MIWFKLIGVQSPVRRRSCQSFMLLWIVLTSLGGCALYGPGVTQTSQLAYNDAVQASTQQELLLNLVRLRYTDAPVFLAISSISAQMTFDATASIGGEFGEVEDADTSLVTPGASVGYSEQPTMTFTPELGAEFTRQLVAPVELDSLYLLSQYGWDLGRVLRITTRELNGIRNAVGREDYGNAVASDLRVFSRMAELFGRLHASSELKIAAVERQVNISGPLSAETVSPGDLLAAAEAGFLYVYRDHPPAYALTKSQQHYVLDVSEAARQSEALGELAGLLDLDMSAPVYELDRAGSLPEKADSTRIRIETRSVLGAMAYLAQAVQVPDLHVTRGMVTHDREVEAVFSDLLQVRVANKAPAGTALAVKHRGYWFYIDESDLSSKRTMGLLTSLVRLEVRTGGTQNVPVLTLPVAR